MPAQRESKLRSMLASCLFSPLEQEFVRKANWSEYIAKECQSQWVLTNLTGSVLTRFAEGAVPGPAIGCLTQRVIACPSKQSPSREKGNSGPRLRLPIRRILGNLPNLSR